MSDQARSISRIKTYWNAIKDPFLMNSDVGSIALDFNDAGQNIHNIIFEMFQELKLDPMADASFTIIEEGLTRAKFYQYAAYNAVSHWVSKFHDATSFDGHKTPEAILYGLSGIHHSINRIKGLVAVAGFREDASPLIIGQWNLICELHKQGHIESELKKAANTAARFSAFDLGQRFRQLRNKLASDKPYWEKNGDNGVEQMLSLAGSVLTKIDTAKDAYQPRDMAYEERYEDSNGERKERVITLPYSKEETIRIAQECALLMCSSGLIWAQEAFAARQFAKRAGGFREDFLHFREILGYLDLARFDLDAEETYQKIGTTKKEFLTCYHFQIDANDNPPLSRGYVGVRTDYPQRFKLTP